MSVVAKLYVASIKRGAGAPDAIEVTMGAVTRGEENRAWAEASPQASFSMTIQNPVAAAQFTNGQEFYVTFEPAEPVVTLATCPGFQIPEYYRDKPEPLPTHVRCEICNCKTQSHDEPLRSVIVQQMGLSPRDKE